jgi:UDP-glucuronate decarboxylase
MHPNEGRVVDNFIVQALLGRDITVFGDVTRSFCYVDDLIEGMLRMIGDDNSLQRKPDILPAAERWLSGPNNF